MDEENVSNKESVDQSPLKVTNHTNKWIIGFALLITGGVLLVRNLAGWQIDNWWFVLLIIPSIAAFATAWRRYNVNGSAQRSAIIRPIMIGIVFLLAAVFLLFNLDGKIILPVLLIVVGVIAFMSMMLR
jgi:hypothetical protein